MLPPLRSYIKRHDRLLGPKYLQFYSKNKFEKLVHLVGFVIRMFDCGFIINR